MGNEPACKWRLEKKPLTLRPELSGAGALGGRVRRNRVAWEGMDPFWFGSSFSLGI
jgi:hypothetical protein